MEYRRMKEQPPASEAFSHELQTAIATGESGAVRAAIERQPMNAVIEGIGNRLLARDFLVSEKRHLSVYDQQLDDAVTPFELATRQCLEAIDSELAEVMAKGEQYRQQPGGAAGRRFVELFTQEASDEACVALLRHLSQVSINDVTALRQPYRFMQYMRNATVEQLWGLVQEYRLQEGAVDVQAKAHTEVVGLLQDIDRRIVGVLFK